jgi:hypothetical protein
VAATKDGASGAVLVRLAGAFLSGIRRGARGQCHHQLPGLLVVATRAHPVHARHGGERARGGGLRRAGAQGAVRAHLLLERIRRQRIRPVRRRRHRPQYMLRNAMMLHLPLRMMHPTRPLTSSTTLRKHLQTKTPPSQTWTHMSKCRKSKLAVVGYLVVHEK